jgi:hypothetical protein
MALSGQLEKSLGLTGGTDGTEIGNLGDRLKVDVLSNTTTTNTPSWSKKLRYEDMGISTGGVARGTNISTSTSWTTIYSYAGSGYLAGCVINVETFSGWEFRLQVDGDTIFQLSDSDTTDDQVYDLDDVSDVNQAFIGLSKGSHDRLIFHPPLSIPIYYASSVVISIRRPSAGAKKFRAGLAILSKES